MSLYIPVEVVKFISCDFGKPRYLSFEGLPAVLAYVELGVNATEIFDELQVCFIPVPLCLVDLGGVLHSVILSATTLPPAITDPS